MKPLNPGFDMVQLLYVGIAISAGVLNALQIGMIGGISRRTGPFESTMVSMLASVAGLTVLIGVLVLAGRHVDLPSPFGSWWHYVIVAVVMTTSLLSSGRDLPPWLVLTGLASIPYLLAASWSVRGLDSQRCSRPSSPANWLAQ